MRFFKLLPLYSLFILSFSCNNDDDSVTQTIDGVPVAHEFIWRGMNLWYFWQDDVNDLQDDRFSTNSEFSSYLNQFSSPQDLFSGLQFHEDRFSFFIEDYNAFFAAQSGVSTSNGLEFGLARINGGSNLFGIVRYILPNSSASTQNIQRGDVFTTVNGVQLTDTNFNDLLNGSDTYTLNIATITNNVISETGNTITLTKSTLTENPVFITNTLEVSGNRVGYLMYNRFTSDFDTQLNTAFGQLAADGVTDLVLDLRYNPGGSVQSAVYLASLITGQFNGELLLRSRWNDKWQERFSDEQLNRYFTNQLINGVSLNSLNLNRVFIIAQQSSASASELVINSLDPYIDVIHVGDVTRGKNEFSTTLIDVPDCNYILNSSCNQTPNTEHTYAIQPLLGRNENANGFSEYTDGLIPDVVFAENLSNYGVLGRADEPLLARVLRIIETGSLTTQVNTAPVAQNNVFYDEVYSSNLNTPMRDNMYIEFK